MARWARIAALVALGAAACREPAPAVDVETYVGPTHARHDPEQRKANASIVARTLLTEMLPPPPSAPLDQTAASQPVHPPTDAQELAQLVDAVRTLPLDEIGGPARRIAAAEPAVWPQIREGLLAERKAPKGDYRALLDAIGGDVPNRYGHFARAWKKAHGHHGVKLSQDWFEDLLSLPPGRVSGGLRAVYRDCVVEVALLRAAANIGRTDSTRTPEVVEALLDTAYAHRGTFRDEVGRAIQSVGDEAIPHLVVAAMPPAKTTRDGDSVPERRAEYASVQLDRMDRLHPQRATLAVREDPRRLALVLDAYATARPVEAAAVLLDYVDVIDPTVRRSARTAFLAYVTGPPPTASKRTIRLLGGATSTARAHLTYRQRAALAIREVLEREVPDRLEPECEVRRENGSIDLECEAQPERLARAYFGWLDERRRAQDAGAIAAALAEPDVQQRVEQLDRLLAANPTLEVGERLVPVYCEAAEAALATGDHARAGQLWRKSARLTEARDPDTARSLRVRALLAEASVPDLTPEGREMLLTSARHLAPEDPQVVGALTDLRTRDARPRIAGPRQHWAPLAGVVFGLWGLGAVSSWWRRRRPTIADPS